MNTITAAYTKNLTVPNLAAAAGDGQATLSWDDPSNNSIDKYQYSTNGGRTFGTPIAIAGSNKSTTSHTVQDLTNGTEHTFEVESVRGQNFSGWSNQATATPLGRPVVPRTPGAVEFVEPKFADVDSSSVHANNIEALFAAGITTGCRTDPLMYCPDRAVTRAQMASFLVRAFDLNG